MDRRTFLKTSTAAVAAAGVGVAPWRSAQAQAGPIKIGLMASLTGVVAAVGREVVEGTQFYLEQNNQMMGGRKVELIVEDDASNPDVALQKARRLVEQANCHLLLGNVLANTGLAVANYVKGNGTPYFISNIAADDLTQRARIKNVIRVAGYSASASTHPVGDWMLKQGYKKIAIISQDYTYGHEQCGGLSQVFTEGGGQVVQQFWHPLNTADFSPYLGQIADLKIDALYSMETGADATRFIQQFSSFGLKGKIPLLMSMNGTDQAVIRTLGPECEGIISCAHFAEGAPNATTGAFVKGYEAKFGKIPSLYAFSMYSGTMWLDAALKKMDGKVEDREKLIETVLRTELDNSPLGQTVKFDDYGNPVYDHYIRKIVKRDDGKWWNVPFETYPQVSQFWKYDPATYLKQPPYSRAFQGIKKT
ncbi:ABC transporter substrate-binding protein [Tardiphaga sp. 866_E4_N2_1]|uniref:ABC transporter substrate-binding protein n=1 Tax=unclassified Tardiphaga TaxID=2631404 RepID=UPI003F22CCF2